MSFLQQNTDPNVPPDFPNPTYFQLLIPTFKKRLVLEHSSITLSRNFPIRSGISKENGCCANKIYCCNLDTFCSVGNDTGISLI